MIITIVMLIVLSIIEPIAIFAGSYFSGWILSVFVGDFVANSMNILFNTTRFAPDVIPMVCGALGIIGSFLKALYIKVIRIN